ncbi:hypothetical protein BCR33DRAFT_433489 [Rhizoclosmatium globosum]|uniref:Uncharacterized protein n=1 Tax=Rhizoclosmatium globosum TaxID=329046 RepID=A0A1Y2BTR5_9FUNG|nr:hypothetical protein BCR33DRAFT_433489 [Rhizoclosmatium globosum]|eukprot:ORY38158.1 hypothetical protein BCR33DRAFT_433489 [Rhizoclosmatium globosum]
MYECNIVTVPNSDRSNGCYICFIPSKEGAPERNKVGAIDECVLEEVDAVLTLVAIDSEDETDLRDVADFLSSLANLT